MNLKRPHYFTTQDREDQFILGDYVLNQGLVGGGGGE